jgi:hypothetical protein
LKELARPTVAHVVYEFLPLIDEHNKARQAILALEKVWLTKSGFFRVITTLLGMAVVDELRWDRGMSSQHGVIGLGRDNDDVRDMANLIALPLRTGELTYRAVDQPSQRRANNGDDDDDILTRIRGPDNSVNYPPKDGNPAKPRQRSCYICRKYQEKKENTQWMCRKCGMPLCSVDRHRRETCKAEHLHSKNEYLGCGFLIRGPNEFIMPDHLILYRRTRSGAAKSKGKNKVTPSPSNRRKTH